MEMQITHGAQGNFNAFYGGLVTKTVMTTLTGTTEKCVAIYSCYCFDVKKILKCTATKVQKEKWRLSLIVSFIWSTHLWSSILLLCWNTSERPVAKFLLKDSKVLIVQQRMHVCVCACVLKRLMWNSQSHFEQVWFTSYLLWSPSVVLFSSGTSLTLSINSTYITDETDTQTQLRPITFTFSIYICVCACICVCVYLVWIVNMQFAWLVVLYSFK